MPFINRAPTGLLGLLDMKSQGENPPQLSDTVAGVVDLTQLYALNTRATLSQASSLTATGVTAGAFSNLIVPQGELWLVTAMAAHLSAPPLGAAATLSIQVGYLTYDTGRYVALGEMTPVIATGAELVAAQLLSPYLLQPGDAPTVYAGTFTGGPHGVRLSVVRSRFLV